MHLLLQVPKTIAFDAAASHETCIPTENSGSLLRITSESQWARVVDCSGCVSKNNHGLFQLFVKAAQDETDKRSATVVLRNSKAQQHCGGWCADYWVQAKQAPVGTYSVIV